MRRIWGQRVYLKVNLNNPIYKKVHDEYVQWEFYDDMIGDAIATTMNIADERYGSHIFKREDDGRYIFFTGHSFSFQNVASLLAFHVAAQRLTMRQLMRVGSVTNSHYTEFLKDLPVFRHHIFEIFDVHATSSEITTEIHTKETELGDAFLDISVKKCKKNK